MTSCEPSSYRTSHADHGPPSENTSLGFPALQHIRTGVPSFHSLSRASAPRYLVGWKPRSQGLATLSADHTASPRGPLSIPNAHGLRPSKLFSGTVIEDRFLEPLSALALFHKTSQPCAGAPAASSHRASRTPLAPQVISPGQGRRAPLGYRPLGFSLRRAEEKASLFLHPLSSFDAADVSIIRTRNPRGYTLDGLAFSLRKGRRPVWPFPPTAIRHPLRRSTCRRLFFRLERP